MHVLVGLHALPSHRQADPDHDGIGSACDVCPFVADVNQPDSDGDGVGNICP
jgi:hypothetical protein